MKDKIFDIVSNKVVVNENVLLIPWLKAIKDKYSDYMNALSYCHYFTDPHSPYYTYEETVRQEKLLQDYPGDYKVTDKEITDALNELYNIRIKYNTIVRHWESCKNLLDKFSDYADSVILDDSKEGNMAHAQRILDKLDKNMENFRKATKAMEEEVNKKRGSQNTGYDED